MVNIRSTSLLLMLLDHVNLQVSEFPVYAQWTIN